MALIGTGGWNPLGESMWAITSKLKQLNHLNWIEMRRLIGTEGLKSFKSLKSQNPDVVHNFKIPGLAISCDWSPSVFRASFTDFYHPHWVTDPYKRRIGERAHLRGCNECLAQGTHLIVHQIKDLTHCPIHLTPLTSRCSGCGGALVPFLLTNYDKSFGTCHHCQKIICKISGSSEFEYKQRLKFVSEFENWLMQIRKAFSNEKRFKWVQGPYLFRHLAHVHRIVEGPSWVEQCIVNGSVVKSNAHVWKGNIYVPPTNNARLVPELLRQMHLYRRAKTKQQLFLEDAACKKLALKVRRVERHLSQSFKFGRRGWGISQHSPSECTPLYGELIDAFSNGHWFWRRYYDAAFPKFKRLERTMTMTTMAESELFSAWYRSIGRLLWFRRRKRAKPINREFVLWLSNIWLDHELRETFCQFVGMSCRYVGDNFVSSFALEQHLSSVGDGSLWLMKQTKRRTTIICFSTIERLPEFQQLQETGFKGNDLGFCDSFERFRPLIKLLNTTPENKYLWELQWREVRRWSK